MKTLKKTKQKTCQARAKESLLLRLNYCAAVLCVHGFISDSERRKIHGKLTKARDAGKFNEEEK